MNFFNKYPYTDFHELNLDHWIGKIKELYHKTNDLDAKYSLLMKRLDDFGKLVAEMVDDYLSGHNNIALRSDLTSNDIDIEELFTYHFVDGRRTPLHEENGVMVHDTHYIVFQSMVMMPDGNIVTIANNENDYDNICKIRVIGQDGVIIRSAEVYAGHAQDATTDGNKIYICYSLSNPGNAESNLVAVINYPSLTPETPKQLPISISRICYNPDKEQFIVGKGVDEYIFDKTLTYEIDHYAYTWEFCEYYRTYKFNNVSRQGTFYYNNMIAYIYSYPNAICFYDLDTHELVKMYNPPYTIGTGGIFDEIEDGFVAPDGTVWLTAFNVDGDARTAANVIAKWNPWKNSQTLYRKYGRNINPLNIYVNGESTLVREYGTMEFPYHNLTQAIAAIKSFPGTETPINIYCFEGSFVGALRATQCPNINISIYNAQGAGHGTTPFIINGVRLISCNQVYIKNAHIRYNSDLTNESNESVHVDRCGLAELVNCTVNGLQTTVHQPDGAAAYGLAASNGSRVILREVAFTNATTAGLQCNTKSLIEYDSACTFSGRNYVQNYGNVSSTGSKYHTNDATYNNAIPEVETYVISNDSIDATGTYDLFEHTSMSADAKAKLNYLVFDVGASSGYHCSQLIRIPANIETTLNFRLAVPSGANAVQTITGTVNISTGALVISQIGSVKIYQIQAF